MAKSVGLRTPGSAVDVAVVLAPLEVRPRLDWRSVAGDRNGLTLGGGQRSAELVTGAQSPPNAIGLAILGVAAVVADPAAAASEGFVVGVSEI